MRLSCIGMATTMARSNGAVDYPVARGNGHDHRRRVDPLDTADLSSMNYGLSLSKMHSPPPTPGSPPPWPDRLSLRLRSNSGLKLHQNDAALSQYTDYKVNGLSRHSSISPAPQSDATSSSARSPSLTSRRSMTWTTSALTSCLSYLDFLGKDLLQMVMDDPTALRHLVKYCEDQGCEEDIDFLLKVCEAGSLFGYTSQNNRGAYQFHRSVNMPSLPTRWHRYWQTYLRLTPL